MTTTAPTCGLFLDSDETESNVQRGASLEQERVRVVSCAWTQPMQCMSSCLKRLRRRNAMRKGAVRLWSDACRCAKKGLSCFKW